MEQKIKYISLPTGKILHNIFNIKTITNINSNQNIYETTSKEWYEFDVEYIDGKIISLTYTTLNSANLDREFLIEQINYKS